VSVAVWQQQSCHFQRVSSATSCEYRENESIAMVIDAPGPRLLIVQVIATNLPEVVVIEPKVFGDDRGFFLESFNAAAFEAATGIKRSWVQDNTSRSTRGVLRGLHFQKPRPQGKLVRCTRGSVFDVTVDVRRSSDTFLRWFGVELSESNHRQLWVPEGFAHGFLVTADIADVQYKTTDYFVPKNDHGVAWNDETIGIDWPLESEPILSDKDTVQPKAFDAELYP
jgi:dTDP-4-dehydrorhamnose 3,5-epimerase